jgi:NlpC/P60 family putative phage cell wall peptidase
MLGHSEPGAKARRAEILRLAQGWIGTPYQHQASLKGQGADCLGLLRGVWREAVGPEPEPMQAYAPGWAEFSTEDRLMSLAHRLLLPRADARIEAGTVILFRWRPHLPAKHCAIATGPQHFVHAHDGARVCEAALVPSWRRRIAGLFDFPDRS